MVYKRNTKLKNKRKSKNIKKMKKKNKSNLSDKKKSNIIIDECCICYKKIRKNICPFYHHQQSTESSQIEFKR